MRPLRQNNSCWPKSGNLDLIWFSKYQYFKIFSTIKYGFSWFLQDSWTNHSTYEPKVRHISFIIKWVCRADWTKSFLHPTTFTGSDFYDWIFFWLTDRKCRKRSCNFFSLNGSFKILGTIKKLRQSFLAIGHFFSLNQSSRQPPAMQYAPSNPTFYRIDWFFVR